MSTVAPSLRHPDLPFRTEELIFLALGTSDWQPSTLNPLRELSMAKGHGLILGQVCIPLGVDMRLQRPDPSYHNSRQLWRAIPASKLPVQLAEPFVVTALQPVSSLPNQLFSHSWWVLILIRVCSPDPELQQVKINKAPWLVMNTLECSINPWVLESEESKVTRKYNFPLLWKERENIHMSPTHDEKYIPQCDP